MPRTLVATAVLLAAFTAACAKDPNVAKREFAASGDRYAAEGKIAEAIVEYRNAVQQDPQFAEARLKLGDAYFKAGDAPGALREYVRAAELMPDDVAVQLKTGNLMLLARQFDEARKQADKVLAKGPNADAQILNANALAGLNQLDDAVAQMEEAIRTAPNRGATYGSLGALQLIRGDRADAEAAFRRALDVDPKSSAAHSALANFFLATDRRAEAEQELKAAVAAAPESESANRALAYFYLGASREREAEPYLKVVAAASPGSTGPLALADYYTSLRRTDEAKPLLEGVVRQGDAAAVAAAKLRLASIAQASGDATTAMRIIDDVVSKTPDDAAALVAQADLFITLGRLDEALASATKAAEKNPRAAGVQFELGRVHAERRNEREAITAFNRALQLAPRLAAANVELAKLHLLAGRITEAEQFANAAATMAPDDQQALVLLVRTSLAKRDQPRAESWLRKLQRAHPNSAAVQTEVGYLELSRNRRPAARTAFANALALDPTFLGALSGLTQLDLQEQRGKEGAARLDAALRVTPGNPGILLLQGTTHAAMKDTAGAERFFKAAIEADSNYLEAYEHLARLYVSTNRLGEATTQFQEIVAKQPRAVGAQTVVGILFQMQNRSAEARKQFERVLEIDSQAAVAANNLAWIYVQDNTNLDGALRLAQTAKSRLPDQHEVNDTLGWVYYKNGLSSLAIPPLQQAIEKSPRTASYHFHLGLAYAAMNENAKARASLERALALDKNLSDAADARRVLATLKSE